MLAHSCASWLSWGYTCSHGWIAQNCKSTCCQQDSTKTGTVSNCPSVIDKYLGTGPFEGKLEILMSGDDLTGGHCGLGGRIIKMDGELSLHGKRPTNTWSWLRSTASSGSTKLIVQGKQDWTTDDELLIAKEKLGPINRDEICVASIQRVGYEIGNGKNLANLFPRHFQEQRTDS